METPHETPRSPISEAGWHARMSSRLAGKGACARCLSGFPTSGSGRRPDPFRATEGNIEHASISTARGFGTTEVVEKVSQAASGKPLITNILRGHVAEAIIALALEPEWAWCSADYAGWDFERSDGLRLEVKQSAVRQSWGTDKPSKPSFDVAARTGYWEGGTRWIEKPGRAAHLYILAHHGIYDDSADHRDPFQWEFFVIPSGSLPDVKRISLGTVRSIATAVPISELGITVRSVAMGISLTATTG